MNSYAEPITLEQTRGGAGFETTTIPNLAAVKARQKASWEAGDFGQVARTIENVAEEFMARLAVQAGTKVLDLACGTGNLAIIAARRRNSKMGVTQARAGGGPVDSKGVLPN